MKTVYKIRRRSDGLYSTGGYSPSFTVKGKIWNNKSALHNHLGLNPKTHEFHPSANIFSSMRHSTRDAYNGCDIVELEIVETEKGVTDADVYRGALRQTQLAKKAAQATRIPKCPTCHNPLNTHLGKC